MGTRKVIKFGRSSFVVSLPNEWVSANSIKKGDELEVLNQGGVLIIETKGKTKEISQKSITIKIENENQLRAKLISAYINNYDPINIFSSDMVSYSKYLRKVVELLMGLEIVEETENKVVLQDFMDISNVNIRESVRRLDRTLQSMMEDSLKFMKGINTYDLVFNKEEDINKLTYFMFKVLKKALRPQNMKLLEIKPQQIIRTWEIVIFIERLADKIKRLVRFAGDLDKNQELIPLMEMVFKNYRKAMKAYLSDNIDLAMEVTLDKKSVVDACISLREHYKESVYWSVVDRIGTVNSYARSIANCVLRFQSE